MEKQTEQNYLISESLRKGLLDYLNSKPNQEVMQGVLSLMNLQPAPETTVKQPKK